MKVLFNFPLGHISPAFALGSWIIINLKPWLMLRKKFQGRKYWFSKTLEQRLNMKANHFIKTSERYFRDTLVKNTQQLCWNNNSFLAESSLDETLEKFGESKKRASLILRSWAALCVGWREIPLLPLLVITMLFSYKGRGTRQIWPSLCLGADAQLSDLTWDIVQHSQRQRQRLLSEHQTISEWHWPTLRKTSRQRL